jgi:hypothetical protein
MQATYELKKAPDRLIIAGFGMLAALVIGGAGGYAVKGITAVAPAIPVANNASHAAIASQASDPGFAKRALRLELQDQKGQASSVTPATPVARARRLTEWSTSRPDRGGERGRRRNASGLIHKSAKSSSKASHGLMAIG